MKANYNVTGMTCSACSARVEKAVSKLSGIQKVTVNLLTNSMQVEYDENQLSERQIIDAVVRRQKKVQEEVFRQPKCGGEIKFRRIQWNSR